MLGLNPNLKKAALQRVAFFFLIMIQMGAAPKVAVGKSPITRAQEFLVNRNRQSAISVLQQARNSNLKAEEKEELNEALKDVATRFLTDKGQRSFELGISQLPLQANSALTHLREAEALEDGNFQILEAMLRASLAAEDCKAALKLLPKLTPLSAVMPQILELELQAYWCLERNEDVELLLKRKALESKLSLTMQKVASAWLKWKNQESDKAIAGLREAAASDAKNPAILYWLWRIEKEQEMDAQAAALAFSKRCRGYEAEFRRHSSSMIEMCLHLPAVEAYLKAKGAENPDAN